MRKRAKLFAIVTASAICTFSRGSGSSPHTYALGSLTPSEAMARAGDFTSTLNRANFNTKSTALFGGATLVPNDISQAQLRVLVPASVTPVYWSTFTPPEWPGFTPPLTPRPGDTAMAQGKGIPLRSIATGFAGVNSVSQITQISRTERSSK